MMNQDINTRFAQFRNGCDDAPERTYTAEKELRAAIGEAVDTLSAEVFRLFGHHPDNCDGVHHVEATIYEWLTKGTTIGATLEGFGYAMDTPARDRVIAQAIRSRDFLEKHIGARS